MMRKIPLLLALMILIVISLSSCSKNKSVAQKTAKDFFASVKKGDETSMQKLYPKVTTLSSYYKSDTASIENVKSLDNDKYEIKFKNRYTNGFGKLTETEIYLYLRSTNKDGEEAKYQIYDSKGLCDFSDNPIYAYAKRKGIITSKDVTDQQISSKMTTASLQLLDRASKIRSQLESQVRIVDWNWETNDYTSSASGDAIVRNSSPYDIPKLQYHVRYYSGNNLITEDDGYVDYEELPAGSSKSFSFFTNYVGDASSANIRLVFDDEFIYELAAQQ